MSDPFATLRDLARSASLANASCRSCRFFFAEKSEFGHCRRNPPMRFSDGSSAFPEVDDEWWCGEFLRDSGK